MAKEMSLTGALAILSRSHTRDDDLTGYTVSYAPDTMMISGGDYIKAWGEVRRALGQQHKPAPVSGHYFNLPFYDEKGNAYEACWRCRRPRSLIERDNMPCTPDFTGLDAALDELRKPL